MPLFVTFLGSKGPPGFAAQMCVALGRGECRESPWYNASKNAERTPGEKQWDRGLLYQRIVSCINPACILVASIVNFLCYEDWQELSPSFLGRRSQMLINSLPGQSIILSTSSRIVWCQSTHLKLKENLKLHTDFKPCCTMACLFTPALIKSTCYFCSG